MSTKLGMWRLQRESFSLSLSMQKPANSYLSEVNRKLYFSELHTETYRTATQMKRRDPSACNYILLNRKNGLPWVVEEPVEGDASIAHCSAYLEKQHWVIFADGELNHGRSALV